MPRLLSLPLSELFTESSGAASAEYFPSPWHGAPLPIALKARQLAEDAALFSGAPGRRNVLVCRAENDDPAQQSILLIASQSPADFVLPDPNETLPMADRIAGKTSCGAFEEAARSVEILTMAGTVPLFWRLPRATGPDGRPKSPAAALPGSTSHSNTGTARSSMPSSRRWRPTCSPQLRRELPAKNSLRSPAWNGGAAAPPIYDVKWDGMALSPKTTTKPLVEFLLEGIPFASDPRVNSPVTQSLRPRILLEHRDFIAVFKPSGLLSVPGTGGLPNALTIASEMTGTSLTAVHRLDMDTSGILLYGKTPEGIRSLMAAFREGRVEKRYRAVLEGRLPAECGLIDFPITTHPLDRLRQIAALGGREARTQWRRLSEKNGRTLVDFLPLTGRTHQLRLHAAHPTLGLNAPIAGDPYYSRPGLLVDRPETPLLLHAAEIIFPDPQNGNPIRLAEPEPFSL